MAVRTMQLPIEQVQVGDLVIVRGGQSVPVDGEITEGSAYLDESAITGESMPVEKHVGDTVIGATVSQKRLCCYEGIACRRRYDP